MNYNLTAQQVAAVVAMLPDDEDDRLREDMLEGETDLHAFAGKLLSHIEDDEGVINALADQIEGRKARQDRAKQRIASRRDMLAALLDIARIDKLTLPEATLTKRPGKPKLIVANDDAVPDEFQAIKKTPDKKAINSAFETADALPNWLHREPAKDVLTVRRK